MDPRVELERRERELLRALGRLHADDSALRTDRADATADDEHDPEGSTLSGEWQRIDGLQRSARAELAEVRAALDRVAAGTYGVCVICGAGIPEGRLEARPQAATCVACAGAR